MSTEYVPAENPCKLHVAFEFVMFATTVFVKNSKLTHPVILPSNSTVIFPFSP